MLKIAICDDDNYICSEIERIILEYEKIISSKIEVDVFYTGESLIDFIKNEHRFDLLFLDIELGSTTGIEVGSKIRNELDDYISKIVFITSKNGYERQLFDVQPLNFLRKPIDSNKLIKCIKLAVKILDKEIKTFEYQVGYDIQKVEVRNILYFESSLKKIKIVTLDKEEYFYSTLVKIKEKLPDSFVSPHGSFLVNYDYIERITKQDIYMIDGKVIPASRRNMKNIQNLQIQIAREISNAIL